MPPLKIPLHVSAAERRAIEARREVASAAEKLRLTALLRYLDGERQADIGRQLGVHPQSVQRWGARFRAGGLAALATKELGGDAIVLSDAQRDALHARLAVAASHGERHRIQAILDLADGARTSAVARHARVSSNTVCSWRNRYAHHGLGGLRDQRLAARRNPRLFLSPKEREELQRRIARANRETKAHLRLLLARADGETLAAIGRRMGISRQAVQQRLKAIVSSITASLSQPSRGLAHRQRNHSPTTGTTQRSTDVSERRGAPENAWPESHSDAATATMLAANTR